MTITAADIKNLSSSEFSSYSDTVIDAAISESACFIDVTQYANCADTAQLYATAHLLALGTKTGASGSGVVTSEAAGGMSRSYVNSFAVNSNSWWSSTIYGRRLLALKRAHFAPALIVV